MSPLLKPVPRAKTAGAPSPLGPLVPLLRELGDLKRVTSAGRSGSIAARLFRRAWAELASSVGAESVAMTITASALAATRLGDLDTPALVALGLDEAVAVAVVEAGLAEVASDLDAGLSTRLREGLARSPDPSAAPPAFVDRLAWQPRAGITCPGRGRIVLQPAESHAEHCLVVAVYGVVLSPQYRADPAAVFLAGLAHHLHNAAMPDSGFAGEMLLGSHLEPLMRRTTEAALAELPPRLKAEVVAARKILPDAETPEGRAFHAADVLDRVLEIAQHLRAAELTMSAVLDDMALVHEGPVKPFHDRVLAEAGLA